MTLQERVLELVAKSPGCTDREIADVLLSKRAPQQPVNGACHRLEAAGRIARVRRPDGLIGNYPSMSAIANRAESAVSTESMKPMQENWIKTCLDAWLRRDGWTTRIAWGNARGVDIEALRGNHRWLIEVKGIGSRPEMKNNYFISILGEILQRMDDADARYSVALPDDPKFRRLWAELPAVAKSRTLVSALFVAMNRAVVVER